MLDSVRRWQEERKNVVRRGKISLKIVVVGGSGVGKSSVLQKYITGKEIEATSLKTTIGSDAERKTLSYKNKTIELVIWDTAGQERFSSGGVTPSILRNAIGAVVVFDLTEQKTFEELDEWRDMIQTYCCADVVTILVGNKKDLGETFAVSREEAESYMRNNSWPCYFETSAKTGLNIEEVFHKMAELIYEQLGLDSVDIKPNKEEEEKTPEKTWYEKCIIS